MPWHRPTRVILLDGHKHGQASVEIQNQEGFDTFHWRLEFGGVTMQKYALAVTYFLSLAFKHEKFAEALIGKAPEIRLRTFSPLRVRGRCSRTS